MNDPIEILRQAITRQIGDHNKKCGVRKRHCKAIEIRLSISKAIELAPYFPQFPKVVAGVPVYYIEAPPTLWLGDGQRDWTVTCLTERDQKMNRCIESVIK